MYDYSSSCMNMFGDRLLDSNGSLRSSEYDEDFCEVFFASRCSSGNLRFVKLNVSSGITKGGLNDEKYERDHDVRKLFIRKRGK